MSDVFAELVGQDAPTATLRRAAAAAARIVSGQPHRRRRRSCPNRVRPAWRNRRAR